MSYEDIELPDLGIEDEFYEDEEEEPFEEDMEEFCSHLEEYRTQVIAILQNREKALTTGSGSIWDSVKNYRMWWKTRRKNCGSRWSISMSAWRLSMNLRISMTNGWK